VRYFWLNKGPWSIIDGNQSFMPAEYAGIKIPARKPDAANFYPAGASKEALEAWMNALPPRDIAQEIPQPARRRLPVERLPGLRLRLDGPRFAG
jgi:hypothetical protein